MFKERKLMKDKLVSFVDLVAKELPDDIYKKIKLLEAEEDASLANEIYSCMSINMKRAKELNRPICQDTGVLQFYIRAGSKFPYLADLKELLTEVTKEVTKSAPLRPNAVEVFDEVNTGNNVGTKLPWIEWDIIDDSKNLEIEVYMAGGGCSLPGRSVVLPPLSGYEGAVQFVFDTVVEMGINACPPLIVGIGIGTCSNTAASLSKKAMLRPINTSNPHPFAAELEKKIEEGLNNIKMGPQGVTGKKSVLGVNIEGMAHHPSTLGVGITIGCWASRHGIIKFDENFNSVITTHKEK